jgi:hypothetical protein
VRLANLGASFNFPSCVILLPNGYPNPDEHKEGYTADTDGGGWLKDVWQSHKANQKQDEESSNANLSCDPASLRLAVKLVTNLFQSGQHIVFVRHTPNSRTTTILWALVAADTKPKMSSRRNPSENRGHE